MLRRLSTVSVSSGSSSYSFADGLRASTRLRLAFKAAADVGLFALIGFPHAGNVADRSSRRAADHDQTTGEMAETDHACFAMILTGIFQFESQASENFRNVLEIESALINRFLSPGRIVADAYGLL
jgi:hypothetical protein